MIPTIVLFVLCFAAGMRYGSRVLVTAIVSFYPAYLVTENLGFAAPSAIGLLGTFVILWAATYFLTSRVIDGYDAHAPMRRYGTLLFLAAAASWLVILVLHRLIPIDLPFGNENLVTDFIRTLRFDLAFAIPVAVLLLIPKKFF
jgi:hypothetical protein